MISLWNLDPATWQPHQLHSPDRTYVETNCYLDAVIELVAGAGHEPEAMLGAAIAVDFEIDQWTFCKPPDATLRRFYGIDVHEMAPYAGLADQVASRLEHGQTLMPEVDGFHLPDTAGISYRRQHVKTSVIAEAIDTEAERFRYFHNSGYFELAGEDYRNIFRVQDPTASHWLPYTDLVRFDVDPCLRGESLRSAAIAADREQLRRRPGSNPWRRFGEFLAARSARLAGGPPEAYEDLVFATVRMAGSSFELLASHLRWLFPGDDRADGVAADLGAIVDGCKVLSFQLARRRAVDPTPVTDEAGKRWEHALDELETLIG